MGPCWYQKPNVAHGADGQGLSLGSLQFSIEIGDLPAEVRQRGPTLRGFGDAGPIARHGWSVTGLSPGTKT